MNSSADNYFTEGCGRCSLGGTSQCKVHQWRDPLTLLRNIILESGLTEESKWGVPCYTFQKSNIVLISAFKDNCSLSFFKGALLKDTHDILKKPGANTQASSIIPFTNASEVTKMESMLKAYIIEAIEVEKSGRKVAYKSGPEPIPEELQTKLDEDPILNAAFYNLTSGRQRGYILHFSQARKSETRKSRIEKCMPKILAGKGSLEK